MGGCPACGADSPANSQLGPPFVRTLLAGKQMAGCLVQQHDACKQMTVHVLPIIVHMRVSVPLIDAMKMTRCVQE